MLKALHSGGLVLVTYAASVSEGIFSLYSAGLEPEILRTEGRALPLDKYIGNTN
jgi:hypothetical protein